MSRLLAVSIALLPLTIAPGLSRSYDVIPRLALFGVVLGVMLVCAGVWVPGLQRTWGTAGAKRFTIVLLVSAVWAALCTALSRDPVTSLFGSTWRSAGLITELQVIAFGLVAVGTFAVDGAVTMTLRAVAVSGIAGAAYGILQYFNLDPVLPAAKYHAGEGVFTIVRPPGTLGHADYFAAWLVAVVFLLIPLSSGSGGWRWIARIAQVLSAAAVFLSGTRGALLALVAGMIVVAVLLRGSISTRTVALFGVPAVMAVAFIALPAGAPLRARVHWSIDDARGGARLLLWRDTLGMIAKRPVFGFGPETYSSEFPRFQSVELARQYPDWYHESPHNAVLDAAVSEGMPGLLLAILVFGIGLRAARSRAGDNRILSAALVAALIAELINAHFVALTFTGAVFLMLTLSLAVSSGKTAAAPQNKAVPRWIWCTASAAALIMTTCDAGLLASDIALARFDQALRGGHIAEGLSAYASARRWSPSGRAGDLYCSRMLFAAAEKTPNLIQRLPILHEAVLAGARATTTADDRQNAWYSLAMITAAAGDARNVEQCLRQAISSAPNWYRPHWALARLLRSEGRTEEAGVQFARAIRLNGGHDAMIAASTGTVINAVSSH